MLYQLTEDDITLIALGTAFLGSGGGGDVKIGEMLNKKILQSGSAINVIPLAAIPDDALVVAAGLMGAPTVFAEKFFTVEEGELAIKEMEKFLQAEIDYIITMEIGGTNGLYGSYLAAQTNKIIVDGDCMGRAFPEIQMVTPNIYGDITDCYAVLANGQHIYTLSAPNLRELEIKAREKTMIMGGSTTVIYLPMTGKQARAWCVPHSLTVARKIGSVLNLKQTQHLCEILNEGLHDTGYGAAKCVVAGKIIELNRSFTAGFNRGWIVIENINTEQKMMIEFQNENLRITDLKSNSILAVVPTIITLLDNALNVVACENLRIGLEVMVLTLKVPALLQTEKANSVLTFSC